MKKTYLYTLLLGVSLFAFAACELMPTPDPIAPENRYLILSGSLGEENPVSTKMFLNEDPGRIRLEWEPGDVIQFGFKQGSTRLTSTALITSDNIDPTNTRRVSDVQIPIPSGINAAQPYELYATYGPANTLIVDENVFKIKLPLIDDIATGGHNSDDKDAWRLVYIQNHKVVRLYFHKSVPANATQIVANFKHLGALFCVTIKNTTSTSWNNYFIRLIDKDELSNVDFYVYNNGKWTGFFGGPDLFGSKFNLETETPEPTNNEATNYIVFDSQTVPGNGTATWYAWYPVKSTVGWPSLRLQICNRMSFGGLLLYTSENYRPQKTAGVIVPGKRIMYHAIIKKTPGDIYSKVYFTDKDWNILPN